MVACIQFPDAYPDCKLLLEIKSKTIPGKFIEGLVAVCDQEMERHLGEKQVSATPLWYPNTTQLRDRGEKQVSLVLLFFGLGVGPERRGRETG